MIAKITTVSGDKVEGKLQTGADITGLEQLKQIACDNRAYRSPMELIIDFKDDGTLAITIFDDYR